MLFAWFNMKKDAASPIEKLGFEAIAMLDILPEIA
jgi:hypothetical protein